MLLEQIKFHCQKQGTTIPKLEKELGFGSGTIYKWETVSPSAYSLKKVADYLGCTVDDLLKEEIGEV